MRNLKKLWGADSSKKKFRPRYLTHPAFLLLVGLNIAAAAYGAYLWFSQKKMGTFSSPPSSSVLVAGHSDSESNSPNPFAASTEEPGGDQLASPQPEIQVKAWAGLESKPVEPDSSTLEPPITLEPPKEYIVTASASAGMEAKPVPVEPKVDTTSQVKPNGEKGQRDIAIQPEKVEEKENIPAVNSEPKAEQATNASSETVLVSHNASPGKARPYIHLEKDIAGKGYYTVAEGSAYFHNEPDPATRRKAFIIHWNKAVLKPIEEKNGFIYIVYTNQWGKTSKGWLNKQDLKLLDK